MNQTTITDEDIKSVNTFLQRMFPKFDWEDIEDATSEAILWIIEHDHTLVPGLIYTYAKFILIRKSKKTNHNASLDDLREIDMERYAYDAILEVKEGLVDEVLFLVENSEHISARDLEFYKRCTLNGESVVEVSNEVGLSYSYVYRMIKETKKKVIELANALYKTR